MTARAAVQMTSVTAADDEKCKNLNFSTEAAIYNYNQCGSQVHEPEVVFKVSGPKVMRSEIVTNMISSSNLPFEPDTFQKMTWNAVAAKNSVILTAPCSSGKMITAEKCVDIMQKVTHVEDGVGLGVLPLSSIMQEAIRKDSNSAFITMKGNIETGEVKPEEISEESWKKVLRENLLKCKYKVIYGHPESFDSEEGRLILEELEEQGKIVFIFIDEGKCHQIFTFSVC